MIGDSLLVDILMMKESSKICQVLKLEEDCITTLLKGSSGVCLCVCLCVSIYEEHGILWVVVSSLASQNKYSVIAEYSVLHEVQLFLSKEGT